MSALFLTGGRRIVCALVIGDMLVISLGLAGLALFLGHAEAAMPAASMPFAALAGFIPFQLVALYTFGLQAPTTSFQGWRYGMRLALALTVGLAGLGIVNGLCGVVVEPGLLAAQLAALFCLLFASRYVVLKLAFSRIRRRRLAVVGELGPVCEFVGRIRGEPFSGYSIVRICVPPSDEPARSELSMESEGIQVSDEVGKLLGGGGFDAIAFDPHCRFFTERDLCTLAELSNSGVAVYDLATLSKGLVGRFPRSSLDPIHVAEAICARNASIGLYSAAKRALDVGVAVAGLLLGALPMLCLALIIRLDSPGPALLRQARVGYRGRVFQCFKFRTMKDDPEGDVPWTAEADPRITRVGRFLRKLRLDELPQLVNVLRGDMSLVGPRPVLEKVAQSVGADLPLYAMRHTVRPGLTGWAQVKQGYAGGHESELAKLRYDLYYIEKRSLALDIFILLMTTQIVVGGAGR